MTQPPSTRARNILMRQRDSVSIQNDISIQSTHVGTPRIHFKRSALCTALATSLVSVAPAALAETTNTNITNPSTSNQVAKTQSVNNQTFAPIHAGLIQVCQKVSLHPNAAD